MLEIPRAPEMGSIVMGRKHEDTARSHHAPNLRKGLESVLVVEGIDPVEAE
jgi:hypothetical protein